MVLLKQNINKKGVSPLIATVLLISLVIILIVTIVFWVKGFVNERISKEGALADAELKCTEINLDIKDIRVDSADGIVKLMVTLQNAGSEDIAGIIFKIEDPSGNSNLVTVESIIRPFETFSQSITDVTVGSGYTITLIPNVRPEGAGAPLVPCSGDKVKKVTLT